MPHDKMTDRQIAQLYSDISKDYKKLKDDRSVKSALDIYNHLYNNLYWSMQEKTNPLYSLTPTEKYKAYTILNTFFHGCPEYQQQGQLPPTDLFRYGRQPTVVVFIERNNFYCRNNDFFFTWLLLQDLSFSARHRHHGGGFGGWSDCCRGNSHHHSHSDSKKEKNGEGMAALIALLVLAALALIALVLAAVAMYYLLTETCNGLERMWHNEGWLQAGFSFLGMAAGGAASAMLTQLLLAAPLTSLALIAGLNPAGVVITGVICLGILGAALGCLITNMIQKHFSKANNPDALDPEDPNRFYLSASQEEDFLARGLDPVKVKCAMVALRWEIVDEKSNKVTSYLGRDKNAQDSLDKIRQLRHGHIPTSGIVKVGDMTFDCLLNRPAAPVPANYAQQQQMFYSASSSSSQQQNADFPPPYSAGIGIVQPSAPPCPQPPAYSEVMRASQLVDAKQYRQTLDGAVPIM